MKNNEFTFNRVLGLKFLHDFFPYFFKPERVAMHFVDDKNELFALENPYRHYDTYVLKRSGNGKNSFLSDIKCKDNRFFTSLDELKEGAKEFEDRFVFCVECHKFKENENYYSDKLAIAQFSTEKYTDARDKISFIPSVRPGVSTRDNMPYLMIDYPFDSTNIFHVKKLNEDAIKENGFNDYSISYLAKELHRMVDSIRELLLEEGIHNSFQLIVRIDSYLNLLPIDFRTPEAWASIKS